MNPIDSRMKKLLGLRNTQIMKVNNLILFINGTLVFMSIEGTVFLYKNYVVGVLNYAPLFHPIPSLIFAILLGNLHFVLSNIISYRFILDFMYSILIGLFAISVSFLNIENVFYLTLLLISLYFLVFYLPRL
jgi:hypothetical protein